VPRTGQNGVRLATRDLFVAFRIPPAEAKRGKVEEFFLFFACKTAFKHCKSMCGLGLAVGCGEEQNEVWS
jgi:hypothetical protein